MKPLVRVVVLNYNGGELTLQCLEQLEWPRERVEVVVVDNGSQDGSAATAQERFPTARLIEAGRNLGFAGGNSLGLRDFGETDYVALLNNDAWVEPGWLGPLVAELWHEHARELYESGYDGWRLAPYGYLLPTEEPLARPLRRAYREVPVRSKLHGTPEPPRRLGLTQREA